MKTKLIGLGILAAVIIAAAAYVFISNSQTVTEINGYVGGEKIGLLEDEEVQDILRDRYRLVIDYAKAGSIDMVTDDAEGRDFLFPSNQTALELYKQVHGDPVKSEIILNPIPAICSPGFWPIPSAAAWRAKATLRRSCPGCKIFFRSWGIWKAPPRICSISF